MEPDRCGRHARADCMRAEPSMNGWAGHELGKGGVAVTRWWRWSRVNKRVALSHPRISWEVVHACAVVRKSTANPVLLIIFFYLTPPITSSKCEAEPKQKKTFNSERVLEKCFWLDVKVLILGGGYIAIVLKALRRVRNQILQFRYGMLQIRSK